MGLADSISHDQLVRQFSDAFTGGQVGDRTPPKPCTVWAGPGYPVTTTIATISHTAIGIVDSNPGNIAPINEHGKEL